MNKNVILGRFKQDKADAEIWFGKKIGGKIIELNGNKNKIVGYFHEKEGLLKEHILAEIKKYEVAKDAFETRTLEVDTKIQSQFDKFTHSDIKEIKGSLKQFANKVQEKYYTTDEQANKKVKEFMSQI